MTDFSGPAHYRTMDIRVADRQARTYMAGASVMTHAELVDALALAQLDPELKGKVREVVLARYVELIEAIKRKGK
jgi:hypothetical protein